MSFIDVYTSDTSDKKFPGIYRGVVVSSDDPLSKNRLKVKVPQVTGDSITNWAWPVIGGINQGEYPYGIFTKNTTSTAASSTVAYAADLDTTEDSGGGVYITTANPSRVYVSQTGDYQILFSPQFRSSNASAVIVDVWLRINGTDVPRSRSAMTLQGNPNYQVFSIPFIADLEAGDYVEVMWHAGATDVSLFNSGTNTSPDRPAVPAIIMQVSLIGNYRPQVNTGVWIMYEGGDPNFPVWMGAF